MPIPKRGETRSEFISRCIEIRQAEYPDEPTGQSVAVCSSMYGQKQTTFKEIVARELNGPGAHDEIVIFAAGEIELEGSGSAIMDAEAAAEIIARIERRGVDIVIDYEHATLTGEPAPAAGWIAFDGLRWDPERGLIAKVRWTAKAKRYLESSQYRYHSPVFSVDDETSRISSLHSVALTNSPLTNNIMPIAAKQHKQEKMKMDFMEQIIAALGLESDADEKAILDAIAALKDKADTPSDLEDDEEVVSALGLGKNADKTAIVAKIKEIGKKQPEKVEVIPGNILEAVDVEATGDFAETKSAVVAKIHAMKQVPATMVPRQEFDELKASIAKRDADDAVKSAIAAGKITPDQKEWAAKYASEDLKGFQIYVASAPVVVPVDPLPTGNTPPADPDDPTKDENVMAIAAKLGVTADDLKKYGR